MGEIADLRSSWMLCYVLSGSLAWLHTHSSGAESAWPAIFTNYALWFVFAPVEHRHSWLFEADVLTTVIILTLVQFKQ
jgi:hypothetical protein